MPQGFQKFGHKSELVSEKLLLHKIHSASHNNIKEVNYDVLD